MTKKCQARRCDSGLPGTVVVKEKIGHGLWSIWICTKCLKRLNAKEGDTI